MPRRPQAEDALGETRVAFADGMRRGDAAAACAVYADGATLLGPSSELIHGRVAIQAFWGAGVAAGVSEVELEAVEATRHDGLGYEIGRYALRLDPPGGEAIVDRGTYMVVHERQPDGSWLRIAEMFNSGAPPVGDTRRHGAATNADGGSHAPTVLEEGGS